MSDVNHESLSLGGDLKLKIITPEQWENRPEKKTCERIYAEMQELLLSRSEELEVIMRWVDRKFINLEETQAKCKAIKEAVEKAKQDDSSDDSPDESVIRSRRRRDSLDDSSDERELKVYRRAKTIKVSIDKIIVDMPCCKFFPKTDTWTFEEVQTLCEVDGKDVQTLDRKLQVGTIYTQFNTWFQLSETRIRASTRIKSCKETRNVAVYFESFGQDSGVIGGYWHSNGFRYSDDQGMR